jgi:hypothetical protein
MRTRRRAGRSPAAASTALSGKNPIPAVASWRGLFTRTVPDGRPNYGKSQAWLAPLGRPSAGTSHHSPAPQEGDLPMIGTSSFQVYLP